MSNSSLINLGDLAKPVNTLVEKISDAVGILYEPHRIRNNAEAEADAAITKAQAEIDKTDLQQRAEQRRIVEDMRHQKNMDDIIAKAIPHVDENAPPENMDNDWIINLFEKCRTVSDEEMQSLWARVLATEANTPGTLSKRTVNRLSDFDKSDAELFTTFCGFCWEIENITPLVFNIDAEIYNKHGINIETLNHLDTIGLIHFERTASLTLHPPPKAISYYGKQLEFSTIADIIYYTFYIGQARLTTTGEELFLICGSQPVDGFYEYVKEQLRGYLL